MPKKAATFRKKLREARTYPFERHAKNTLMRGIALRLRALRSAHGLNQADTAEFEPHVSQAFANGPKFIRKITPKIH